MLLILMKYNNNNNNIKFNEMCNKEIIKQEARIRWTWRWNTMFETQTWSQTCAYIRYRVQLIKLFGLWFTWSRMDSS